MATIDDKVVAMSFESSKFESGVSRVLGILGQLKKALSIEGAGKGLKDIDAAGKNVDLSHIAKSVDEIRNKFSALSVAALAVFAAIVTKAINTGAQMAKAFTLGPVIEGFREYETQLNSVQTILSNTTAAGTKLKDVTAALDELNEYADKTIYNFSEMTRNIGTFTAAGVDLETSVSAIKGIANLAAISGSNSGQAATAMYQLSQAISAGRVNLMDWNSVVNAGMGGTVFQRALAQTAVNMGTLDKNALKLTGTMKNVSINGESFRQSLSATGPNGETWLTSEVLVATLEQLSGNLSDAELKAKGYTAAQIEAIQTQAKMALAAATEVKTFTQLLDTTKEALASGWAQTWKTIFGDFGEAKVLFTGVSNAVNELIENSAKARNKVLGDWKKLGGRDLLINSLKIAFQSLGQVLGTIRSAFRDIFPPATGQTLFNITKSFNELVKNLKPGEKTLENLRRTFRGLFAVLDIGRMIVVGIFSVIGRLFGVMADGRGGFLSFTAAVGDFLVSLRNTLKEGKGIERFFEVLAEIVVLPIDLLKRLVGAITGVTSALGPQGDSVSRLSGVWEQFLGVFTGSDQVFENVRAAIGKFFSGLGGFIQETVSNISWDNVFAALNTGLLAALVLGIRSFLSNRGAGGIAGLFQSITEAFTSLSTSVFPSIAGSFNQLGDTLGAVQSNIKAKTLKEIAIALLLLAGALFVLSTIPSDKMASAMSGLVVAMGSLVGAMALLEKVAVGAGFLKLPIIAGGLILLAVAVGALSLSVKGLSTMDWEELARGLTGVGSLLLGLSASAKLLAKNSLGLIAAGAGITAIAIAMKILASAVKDFGGLSWTELGKGMSAIAGALVAIGLAAKLFPPNMIFIGAGLIAVGYSLKVIASAMNSFAKLSWENVGKGLAAIAGALILIAGAMKVMPPTMALQAAGLILVGVALNILAKALEKMGGMSIDEIGRSLGVLAGALLILAAALMVMGGTLGGAAALAVAAVGVNLLATALKKLGGQSWGEIIKGLVALGAALVLIAGAALLLSAAIPAMLALGLALVLIGGGLALAGAGIFLIGAGLSAIAVAGPAAIAILVGALTDLMEKLPEYAKNVVEAFLVIAKSLAESAPEFVASAAKILVAVSQAIILAAPQLVAAAVVVVKQLLAALRTLSPDIIATGMQIILDLLKGIRDNIEEITTVALEVVQLFLVTLAKKASDVIKAGADFIVSILRGIASGITRVIRAGGDIVIAIVRGIGNNAARIVTAATQTVVKFVQAIGQGASRMVTAGATMIINVMTGIGRNANRLVTAGTTVIIKFVEGISRNGVRLVRAAAQSLLDFLNGLKLAIDQYSPQITAAAIEIGVAIIAGIIKGMLQKAQDAYATAQRIADKILSYLKNPLKIFSPSKVTTEYGKFIVLGLSEGMKSNAPKAYESAIALSNGIISAVKKTFQIQSPSKVMRNLGIFVGEGFLQGLQGSQDSIRRSVEELRNQLFTAMYNAKVDIARHKEELEKLRKADKPDTKAIAEAQKMISENERLLKLAAAATKELTKNLIDERQKLSGLAKKFSDLAVQFDAAVESLEAARKVRDDAAAGFADQYATLPDIDTDVDPVEALEKYKAALANQAAAVATYGATLEQLRKLGLNDRTYQQLLEDGTANQAFADQLLAGGATAIAGLNELDAQLESVSKSLGTTAASNLYQAGVDAAKGLVEGLKSQLVDIQKEMNKIATAMVKAIRKALKIKSPSRVFENLGKLTAEGLTSGLKKSTGFVANAAETVGTTMIDTMRSTISGVSDILSSEIDANPSITPVLDLTDVKKGADGIGDILSNVVPISAASSYGQAASISDQVRREVEANAAAAATGTVYQFEQNNYSPKALSEIELYRMTRNQLAQARLAT